MPLSTSDVRRSFPCLVHFAPRGALLRDRGLLTAAQVLDENADSEANVWTKFVGETDFLPWPVDHWKSHSRFRRKAGAAGSNLIVRSQSEDRSHFFLGNNFPLGDGSCLGKTIPLTDNRPGDAQPTARDWFRILNDMFWVFDAEHVNEGVVENLRRASPDGRLSRAIIKTDALSDEFIESHVRLSVINGGGSNGGLARGTATYKRPSEWTERRPPREIGILRGLPAALVREIGLVIEDA